MELHVPGWQGPQPLLRLDAPLAEEDLSVVLHDAPYHVPRVLVVDVSAGTAHVSPVVLRPHKVQVHLDPHCVQKEMVCLGLCGMSEGSSASVETARRMSALLCKIWAVMVGVPMPKDFVKIWYRLLEVAARKSTGAGEGTLVWARGAVTRVGARFSRYLGSR